MKIKKLSAREYVLYSSVILLGVLIDQISKLLAVKFLKPVHSVPIFEGVLHLTYSENRGAAFGILENARWLFISFSSVAIVGLSLYIFLGLCESKLYSVGMPLIISGGIGNMIDRLALGYVVDFIDFTLIDFAIFNLADSLVCIGAGFLVLALIRELISEIKKLLEGKKE